MRNKHLLNTYYVLVTYMKYNPTFLIAVENLNYPYFVNVERGSGHLKKNLPKVTLLADKFLLKAWSVESTSF